MQSSNVPLINPLPTVRVIALALCIPILICLLVFGLKYGARIRNEEFKTRQEMQRLMHVVVEQLLVLKKMLEAGVVQGEAEEWMTGERE